MSKHTPGPWVIGRDVIGPKSEFGFLRHVVIKSWDDEQGEADHRLIAAAPDLLASLRGLLVLMTQAIASGDWRVDGACDPDAEVIRARIAIAKATGATP